MQNSLNDDSADDAELLDAYTRDALLHWDSQMMQKNEMMPQMMQRTR